MKKLGMTFVLVFLAFCLLPIVFLFIVSTGWAATYSVTCAGDITSALNSAVRSAVSGDTISIGAGTCTMDHVAVVDKGITIQGAGQGVTNITPTGTLIFTVQRENANNGKWRISGMTFSGSQTRMTFIMLWGAYGMASPDDLWRIDHVTFNFPNAVGYGIHVYGPSWGLIDNCNITISGGMVINAQAAYLGEDGTIDHLFGSYLLSHPLQPGSNQAIYIEDNVINCPAGGGCAAIDTSNCASRFVVRHNRITNGMFYAHWTRGGGINGVWFEIYNNKMTWTGSEMYPVRFEAGTGLIYNNTLTGFIHTYFLLDERRPPAYFAPESGAPLLACDGTHSWDGNAGDVSAPGWPCLGQIGRASGKSMTQIRSGDKQTSFPFYSWNNGTQDKCYNPAASGSACTNTVNFTSGTPNYVKSTAHVTGGYGNGDKDFCSGGTSQPASCGTHALTYTPYTYPHPLQVGK